MGLFFFLVKLNQTWLRWVLKGMVTPLIKMKKSRNTESKHIIRTLQRN